ncbi:MAG: hypothetical protein ABJB66_16940 [Gemmatimonadaceae bacterium]
MNAVLIALFFICGVAISLTFTRANKTERSNIVTSNGVRPLVEDAIGHFAVSDTSGHTVPLVTKGEPAIIMVSSRTCAWCKQTLADLRVLANGRPLPRLKVLTLEGAGEGVGMVASEGLIGVQLIGPIAGADQVQLTFRYPGTPTFLAIDRDGRVVRTMPGYPMGDELKRWFNVMVGDADTPR